MYEQKYCAICGHPIGDGNLSGIGSQCKEVYTEASIKIFYAKHGLDYHIVKANLTRELFVDVFKDTKFRSSFKKSFYQSMVSAEKISKKQLDIMNEQLNGIGDRQGKLTYEEYHWFKDFLDKVFWDLIEFTQKEYWNEIIPIAEKLRREQKK